MPELSARSVVKHLTSNNAVWLGLLCASALLTAAYTCVTPFAAFAVIAAAALSRRDALLLIGALWPKTARKEGLAFRRLKKTTGSEESEYDGTSIRNEDDIGEFIGAGRDVLLFAGTAGCSRARTWTATCDTLVIDKAGQVSLAVAYCELPRDEVTAAQQANDARRRVASTKSAYPPCLDINSRLEIARLSSWSVNMTSFLPRASHTRGLCSQGGAGSGFTAFNWSLGNRTAGLRISVEVPGRGGDGDSGKS
jgi:hypothetical protein